MHAIKVFMKENKEIVNDRKEILTYISIYVQNIAVTQERTLKALSVE